MICKELLSRFTKNSSRPRRRNRRQQQCFSPSHHQTAIQLLEDRVLLAAITVTGIGDTIAVDGLVTLREAMTSANNNADVNEDVVTLEPYE